MDATYPQNPPKRSSQEQVQDLISDIQKIRSTVAKVRTAGAILSSSSIILPAIIAIVILMGVGVLFAVVTVVQRPLDNFDFATQCFVLGTPADERCTELLLEKVGDQLAPEEESKGGINNPNETFPN